MIIPYDDNWSSGGRITPSSQPPTMRSAHGVLTVPTPCFAFHTSTPPLSASPSFSFWGFCFHQQRALPGLWSQKNPRSSSRVLNSSAAKSTDSARLWAASSHSHVVFLSINHLGLHQVVVLKYPASVRSTQHTFLTYISLSMQITGTLWLLQSESGLLLVWAGVKLTARLSLLCKYPICSQRWQRVGCNQVIFTPSRPISAVCLYVCVSKV